MMVWALALWLTAPAAAEAPKPGAPFAGETLNYTVNWPSGLSLGEGRLGASRSGEEWRFELSLDASLPGFAITDVFKSAANGDFCSLEFTKESVHGKRKSSEKTSFEASRGIATRETVKGGKSELSISGCPHDALAFLYYLRRELAQGRMPPPEAVYFGAPYKLRLEYSGAVSIKANDKAYNADRIAASVRGPSSDHNFELFIARDAARTPVVIRVPFSLGTFTMELAP